MGKSELLGAKARRKKIVIEKDFNDHAGLATDIAESFSTGPSWCDVILLIQDGKFYSCKGILAAVSPYFREMFSSDFKEPSQREIKLEGFTKVGFKPVWDYIHGTKAEVEGEEGVLATLRDAHFLGLKRLCGKMGKIMADFLTPENSFKMLGIAEQYDCKDLQEAAVELISVRFNQVIHTAEFLDISLQTLAMFLDRDELEVSSEKEIYEATKKWVDHDKSRKNHFPELLHKIRLSLVPYEYLKAFVMKDPDVSENPKCIHLCIDAIDFHFPDLRHAIPKNKSRLRGIASKKIWCLGTKNNECNVYRIDRNDWSVNAVTTYPSKADGQFWRAFAGIDKKLYLTGCGEMNIFDVSEGEWKEGPKPPEHIRLPATAVSPKSMFICGYYNQQNQPVPLVFQFDVESGKWVRLIDMKYPRYGAGACYRDSCLHVLGGYSQSVSNKHERLDLRAPKWEELPDCQQGSHLPAVAFSEAGVIVLSGGNRRKEVYGYDLRQNTWMGWPSMVEGRQFHGLIPLDGKIYAVGGVNNKSIEVFNGTQWEVVKTFDLETCQSACRMIL